MGKEIRAVELCFQWVFITPIPSGSVRLGPGFKTRLDQLVFLLGKEISWREYSLDRGFDTVHP